MPCLPCRGETRLNGRDRAPRCYATPSHVTPGNAWSYVATPGGAGDRLFLRVLASVQRWPRGAWRAVSIMPASGPTGPPPGGGLRSGGRWPPPPPAGRGVGAPIGADTPFGLERRCRPSASRSEDMHCPPARAGSGRLRSLSARVRQVARPIVPLVGWATPVGRRPMDRALAARPDGPLHYRR